jgi:methionyl-tRNA formyltransferase
MPNQPFHIIFCGTSAFAVPSLEALAANPAFAIDLVITQPDRPVGRKQIMSPPPVKVAADGLRLPVFQPQKLNTALQQYMTDFAVPQPDFLIVVSYGQLLSKAILAIPNIAPVNVHASLLPDLRGASPLQHAILLNRHTTGVTIQQMVLELDAGPILSQRSIELTGQETTPGLHDTLATLGAELLIETLQLPLGPTEQDHNAATFCKKLTREDGMADPQTMTAEELDRRVRALNPWPGVTIAHENQNIKILRSSLIETADTTPLRCAAGSTLYLVEVQPASKKPMTGKSWALGR